MNLISCYENCIYQHGGYCKMEKPSAIAVVKVNGCSYFREKRPISTHKDKNKTKKLH